MSVLALGLAPAISCAPMITRRWLLPTFSPPCFALLLNFGCSSGPNPEEGAQRAKLAGDLVQCQNERSTIKQDLQSAQAELKRLKEVNAPPVNTLGGVELQAGAGAPAEINLTSAQLSAVQKVIVANGSTLTDCYEKALKRNPNLRTVSSVNARFTLKGSGSASNVVFSPHVEGEMEKCMAGRFQRWKFPTLSSGEALIELPVVLSAK